ncbi:hypothetical protein DACRYDRAFT_20535 [Dacryopinax primogenitus]|uniref:Uncharacterized protein n=1 Tax=Dacryopinax primogenitus (strain DJM 731) TaxID=1858805 RepID=M5GDZ9_DACPD|nr:uncharacterized protein DACRYDRAFT_20535 [Dacryopinax primogenitus]EJU04962.1 hypothetical protein DACRYDRAFT_20535 [Dacryopinax primogenitus]
MEFSIIDGDEAKVASGRPPPVQGAGIFSGETLIAWLDRVDGSRQPRLPNQIPRHAIHRIWRNHIRRAPFLCLVWLCLRQEDSRAAVTLHLGGKTKPNGFGASLPIHRTFSSCLQEIPDCAVGLTAIIMSNTMTCLGRSALLPQPYSPGPVLVPCMVVPATSRV